MTPLIIVGVLTTAILLYFLARTAARGASLAEAVRETERTGAPEPVVSYVCDQPADRRPTHWDDALSRLWQNYSRIEAARVLTEAARESDASILQYWIRQVLEVEPDIARKIFSEEFLESCYEPEVASRCGKSGCCS